MRSRSLATAAVALLAIAACKGKDQQATNDDLSKDLAAAASNDGLTMAPAAGNAQTVVSAEELSPQARVKRAPSARAPRPSPHRTPHRERVTPQTSTEVVDVVDEAPSTSEVAATAPAPSAPSDEGAAAPSSRPHPVDVPTGNSGGQGAGDGNNGRHGGGIGIGDIIGAIGGVIIRGGVVDGDHCDPRTDGRRGRRDGGGYPVSIPTRRGPISGPVYSPLVGGAIMRAH